MGAGSVRSVRPTLNWGYVIEMVQQRSRAPYPQVTPLTLAFAASIALAIVGPSLIGVALPRSHDEVARPSQPVGALNTLPLELQAMRINVTTRWIRALGVDTTALPLRVTGVSLDSVLPIRAGRRRHGNDAAKGMV